MKPTALISTPNAILWELPPGKPDPKEPFAGYDMPDARTRVTQPAQKGPHCRYYSFLPLRVRIGPIHPTSVEESRSIEKTISLWRKQVIAFDSAHHSLGDLPDEYWIGMSKCDENLLDAFGINLLHMVLGRNGFSELWNMSPPSLKPEIMKQAQKLWDSLSVTGKNKELHRFVTHTMMTKYQLQPSTWTPDQPITHLIQILKNHGPMAVSGSIGTIYYKSPALCSARKILDHSIYYFPKGAERRQIDEAHVIVLIGAETIDGQEIIYYNDPHDISDPISGKKIYAQSYKTFTSVIESRFIVKTAIYEEGQLRETPEAYGIHAHRSLQPLKPSAEGSTYSEKK